MSSISKRFLSENAVIFRIYWPGMYLKNVSAISDFLSYNFMIKKAIFNFKLS